MNPATQEAWLAIGRLYCYRPLAGQAELKKLDSSLAHLRRRIGELDWDLAKKDAQIITENRFRLLTISETSYPKQLREIADPPILLQVMGNLNFGKLPPLLAIVGSRKASPYGLSVAKRFAYELTCEGFGIVSGLAYGIDSAAHRGCLEAGGITIAVLGSGVDRIYPAENKKLAGEISEKGAVISEFPLGATPQKHHFPQRNRVISGLSLGVLVVEASAQSGSLITVCHALDQDREVFAVPGPLWNQNTQGTHRLIKSGAKLVEGPKDVIEELRPQLQEELGKKSTTEGAILQLITNRPQSVEKLCGLAKIPVNEMLASLTRLECEGLIRKLGANEFVRS